MEDALIFLIILILLYKYKHTIAYYYYHENMVLFCAAIEMQLKRFIKLLLVSYNYIIHKYFFYE